jgi:ABC-type phosphate/phosphonate transport system substrate-binding protein
LTAPPVIANARMYAVAPGAAVAWRRLFQWISVRAGTPLEIIDHAYPAPLETLWQRPDLGAAFMCGLPFALEPYRPVPIAAPVPAPPRYGGNPVYCTDFVVRRQSRFATLEDTFGGTIAFTTPTSHSGCNAVRYHLLRYRGPERQRLYARVVGPVVTPRRAVEAVLDGSVDVAPLDSYGHDLMRIHASEHARELRVVASSEMAPIPLLVASPEIESAAAARLSAAFMAVGEAAELADLRKALALVGFVRPDARDYEVLLARQQAAVVAGYPVVA